MREKFEPFGAVSLPRKNSNLSSPSRKYSNPSRENLNPRAKIRTLRRRVPPAPKKSNPSPCSPRNSNPLHEGFGEAQIGFWTSPDGVRPSPESTRGFEKTLIGGWNCSRTLQKSIEPTCPRCVPPWQEHYDFHHTPHIDNERIPLPSARKTEVDENPVHFLFEKNTEIQIFRPRSKK